MRCSENTRIAISKYFIASVAKYTLVKPSYSVYCGD